MQGCQNVQIVEASFGNISTLRKVNLRNCGRLKKMPSSLARQRSLMVIRLANSWKTIGIDCRVELGHGFLPNDIGDLNELRYLSLGMIKNENCQTPSANLSRLKTLGLYNCCRLKEIPTIIGNLSNLSSL
eukprot:Gb_41253 [translate_table: standard]